MAIKVNTGIVSVTIIDENDNQIATLVFDKSDSQIIDKIIAMREHLGDISKRFDSDFGAAIGNAKELSTEQMTTAMAVYRKAADEVMAEFEEIFGEGIFREIFSTNYKLNPDFCPTIDAINSIIDELMPIVTDAIISSSKASKYSPLNKGANTRLEILKGQNNE